MARDFHVLPRVHDLKIAPDYFAAVYDGAKRAEIRKNDRGFTLGDVLVLREWISGNKAGSYTGRLCVARVTHVLFDYQTVGLADGYVSLSIDVVAIDGKPSA